MHSLLTVLLATDLPVVVPDSGLSAVLFTSGVVATGLFARFLKRRRK